MQLLAEYSVVWLKYYDTTWIFKKKKKSENSEKKIKQQVRESPQEEIFTPNQFHRIRQ